MDSFAWRFLRLLVGERFQLRLEAVFDELRIGGRQQVLVGQSPVNPVRRLVGGRKANEFGNPTVAQGGGSFGRQNGLRGTDEFWLAGPDRRRFGDEYLRLRYRRRRRILRPYAISISGRRVG